MLLGLYTGAADLCRQLRGDKAYVGADGSYYGHFTCNGNQLCTLHAVWPDVHNGSGCYNNYVYGG